MALTAVAAAATGLPSFSAQTRLLVVAPHPDDETIACGLLIQQVRAAGGEVQVLLLTAGDNNPWPQRWLERRLWVGAGDRQRWGRRRLREVRQALQLLDVPAQAIRTLDWPDLGVTGCLLQADRAPLAALRAALDRFAPSLIAVPALDDRHPDHAAAHVLIRLALAPPAGDPLPLLIYLVHGAVALVGGLDIGGSPAQRANKLAALAMHHSQMALSGGRMRRMACRPERHAPLPASLTQSSALPWRPPFWLQPWLQLSVVSPAGTHSWRWREAPLQRDESGCCYLPATAASGQPRFVRLALRLRTPWVFDHWGWCEL